METVDVYRSWCASAKSLDIEECFVVVDDLSNLSTKYLESFDNLENVKNALLSISCCSKAATKFSKPTSEKVSQSIAFVDQLLRKKEPSLGLFLARGGVATEVSEADLLHRFSKSRSKNGKEGYITNLEEIEALAAEIVFNFSKMSKYFRVPKVNIRKGTRDVPFGMLVACSAHSEIQLEVYSFQFPSRHDLYNMLIHEIGHIIHFTNIRLNRELQKEAPHLLTFAIHTQEAFYLEFVAQLLHLYYQSEYYDFYRDESFRFDCAKSALVYKNLLGVIKGELSVANAATRHMKYIESDYKETVDVYNHFFSHSFGVIQIMSYYPSLLLAEKFFENHQGDMEKFRQVLRNYQTPTSIQDLLGKKL